MSESDVKVLIRKHASEGHRLLVALEYKAALVQFKKAESLVNAQAARDLSLIEGEQLLFIKANLGIVFYKIGLLFEAFNCFCVCLANLKRAKKLPGGVLSFTS